MINDILDFGFALDGTGSDVAFSGHYINFGVNFVINSDRRFNSTDVKLEVMDTIKDFFRIEKMQFRQPINLNDLQYNILSLDGVIGIKELKLFQNGAELGEDSEVSRTLFQLDSDGTSLTGEAG